MHACIHTCIYPLILFESTHHCFIRVDALVQFLPTKVFRQKCLDLWDSGGSSNQDNLIDLPLAHTCILQNLCHGDHRLFEQIIVEFLEFGTGNRRTKVLPVRQGLAVDRRRLLCRQRSLGQFTLLSEPL